MKTPSVVSNIIVIKYLALIKKDEKDFYQSHEPPEVSASRLESQIARTRFNA